MFIGNQVIRLPEVDSTNTFALGLVRGSSMVAEGVVVTATRQSAGRGQRGNAWFSEAGKNITCSIVLRPTFLEATEQFDLTRIAALAVSDLLQQLLPETAVRIKWPNDIYAGEKKICGILIENVLNGFQIAASVVGIGLNLNQADFGDDAPKAVSVMQLTGQEQKPDDILQQLFVAIERRYLQMRSAVLSGSHDQLQKIFDEYEARLYRRNEKGRFTDFKTIFDGVILGTTDEGKLIVDCEGNKREFGFKEIGFLG